MRLLRRSVIHCAHRPLSASTIRSRPPNGPGAARGFAVAAEFKAALLRFRELNRHPLVPVKFEVPAAADGSDEWPAEWAGMRLGAQAGRYRQRWRRGLLSSADEAEAVRGRRATVVRHTVPAPARKVTCQVRALPRSLRHSLSARRQP